MASPSPLAASTETTNGTKLRRLLIDGGTTVLRQVYDGIHPSTKLAANLYSHRSTLDGLFAQRILSKEQWELLFPSHGSKPDSKTFDITLLFLLLTEICGLSPPHTGWNNKPHANNKSLPANLVRIKLFRNKLIHAAETRVDTRRFNELWKEISGVLVALGLGQAEIDRLKAERCEKDYIEALSKWADREKDIKSIVKEVRQGQDKTNQAVNKMCQTQQVQNVVLQDTKQAVETVSQTQQEHYTLLQDTNAKLEEARQSQQVAESKVEAIHQTQTKTHAALETFRGDLHEIKQKVSSLEEKTKRDREEILQNLATSEFKGDIEYHVGRFQKGTREWVFNKVQNWLDDRNSQNRVMVISANAGMGKSVVAAVICKRMQEAGRLSGSHFCQHNNARYRNPQLMLQSLACHLCHALPEYKQTLVKQLSRNLGKDLNNMGVEELFALLFKEPLDNVADPGRNMLVVIDGLDESEYEERNELLDVIAKHFRKLPPWIRFLCTTRPERNIVKALKHLNPFELEPNKEENVQDIRRLFEERLQYLMKPESNGAIMEKLVEKSEGLMLYAYFLVSYVEENVSVLDQEDLDASLPLNISSVYESYFQRLESELKKLDVEAKYFLNLLCAVIASREPLPIDFVSKVLLPNADSPVERRKVRKAISSVSSLLPIRDECLHIFHKSVKDWLTDKLCYGEHNFIIEEEDEKEGNSILANLCKDELDNLKQKGVRDIQFSPTEKYALHHGTRHMLQLHEEKKSLSLKEFVQSYVLDLELLYAMLCLNTSLAAEEILWLQRQEPFHVLSEDIKSMLNTLIFLLRRHFNIFADHPHVFFQTVLNEGGTVLSSVASNLLQNRYPDIPYMELVHKQLERGAVLARFQCSSKVVCFDVSPQLDYMVCECSDGTIQLWSINTGNRVWKKPLLEKKEDRGNAYRELIVQAEDDDFLEGDEGFDDDDDDDDAFPDFVYPQDLSFYRSVVFHPNGKFVLPGSLCEVYTISGEQTQLFSKSDCRFSVCTFVKDKTRMQLLTDCPTNSKCIVTWNLDTGKEMSRITRKEDIFSFQCSPDGTRLAISHVTGLICVVDLVNGLTEIGQISISQPCGFMNFSPDNQALAGLHINRWSKCLFHLSIAPGNPFQVVDQILSPHSPWEFEFGTENAFLVGDGMGHLTKKLPRVIRFWETGFLEQLNDGSALMSSPDLDYLSLINLDQLNEIRQESPTVVENITFSRNGAFVYVVSGKRWWANQTTVTAWDCSSWERKAEKQLWLTSLVPVKEGIVLMTRQNGKERLLELRDFELSECKPQWTNLEEIEKVIPISEEKVACVGNGNVFVLSTTSEVLEKIAYDNKESIVAINTKTQIVAIKHVEKWDSGYPLEYWICRLLDGKTTQWQIVWGVADEDNPPPLCTFSPKEEFCVIWDNNRVHVRDAYTGELHRELFRDDYVVDCKFVSEKELIVCSKEFRGNFLRIFDVRSGELLSVIEIEEEPFCLGTCLHSLHVAVGLSDSEFKLLRVQLPQVADNSSSERTVNPPKITRK